MMRPLPKSLPIPGRKLPMERDFSDRAGFVPTNRFQANGVQLS
mgnify:CR=1 FL=1